VENSTLDFSLKKEENRNQAYQILAWIQEARQTGDYQQLLER
jgi:hypothetical protein